MMNGHGNSAGGARRPPRASAGLARGAWLCAALVSAGCGSPAKMVLAEAAALEAQGKLEEAAAKLETGCALSPADEPCPTSDQKAAETWQKAAEKAIGEGRYRDAERLLHRARLTADDAANAKITERLAKADLVQGLRYERAAMLSDKATIAVVMEDVTKHDAPAAAKAKEWLDKERPGLFVAAVLAACSPPRAAEVSSPPREGSCTKAWAALQASGAKGPEVDGAQAAAEAEERRVHPLRAQAEGFLPLFVKRHKLKEEYEKCVAELTSGGESTTVERDCIERTYGAGDPEDRFEREKNEDNLFRRTLRQIGDPALTDALDERRRAAQDRGEHVKQDIPKPKPAPKKP